jgi:hypothetical protein
VYKPRLVNAALQVVARTCFDARAKTRANAGTGHPAVKLGITFLLNTNTRYPSHFQHARAKHPQPHYLARQAKQTFQQTFIFTTHIVFLTKQDQRIARAAYSARP